MEKIIEIDVWSDDWAGNNIINVLHDVGIKTAGMHTVINGTFESNVEWQRCKDGEIPSLCVCLTGDAMKSIAENVHETKDVEEKPLFLYRLTVIDNVPDKVEDTTEEESKEEEETMEKKTNVVMNIGMTTKDGVKIDIDSAMDNIGKGTDCTITRCVGFYHGQRENSLRVDIYDIAVDRAISMASYFAHIFHQECVAVSVENSTVFVNDDYTEDEFIEWCNALET